MIKAIIPMKGHNERLPRKNLALLNGVPLFHYLLKTISGTRANQIIVDTDDDEIADAVSKHFSDVIISMRPPEFCGDLIGGNQLLSRFVTNKTCNDIFIQSHVTCPFVKIESFNKAIEMIEKNESDSIFSVTRITQRVWSESLEPINHKAFGATVRTQDLPPLFMENAGFFIFLGSFFLEHNCRNTPNSKMFELTFPETVDIDFAEDLRLAKAVVQSMETDG